MEIIIELSLCINLILNFFIIKSTALFFKEKARLVWLSSALGGVVALLMPLCHVRGVWQAMLTILLSALLVSISFKFVSFKKFLCLYGVFLGITFIFGGACYAVVQAFGSFPLFCVLIVACIIQIAMTLILKSRNRTRTIETFSYKVKLKANGKEIEEEGYLDSGNMLFDPITSRPVVLISFDVFTRIYSDINFLSAYMKKIDTEKLREGHYIKINSVGSATSILVFTAEELEISKEGFEQRYERVALGLSFSGFERAFGKGVLLNGNLL